MNIDLRQTIFPEVFQERKNQLFATFFIINALAAIFAISNPIYAFAGLLGSIVIFCLLWNFTFGFQAYILVAITSFVVRAPLSSFIIYGLSSIVIIIWFFGWLNKDLYKISYPKEILVLFVVFIIWSFLSIAYVGPSSAALKQFVRYLFLFAVSIIVFDQFGNKKMFWPFIIILSLFSLANAISAYDFLLRYGFGKYVSSGTVFTNRVYTIFGNANSVGYNILLSLPIYFAFIFLSREKWIKTLSGIILIVLLPAFFSSLSRSSIIGLAVGLAVVLWFHPARKKMIFLLMAIIMIFAIIIMTVPTFQWLFRIQQGTSNRTSLWVAAIEMIKEAPIFGVGARRFNDLTFYFIPPSFARGVSLQIGGGGAHNYILTNFAEKGFIAAACALGFLLAFGRRSLKLSPLLKRNPRDLVILGIAATLIALIFRSIFEVGTIIMDGVIDGELVPIIFLAIVYHRARESAPENAVVFADNGKKRD